MEQEYNRDLCDDGLIAEQLGQLTTAQKAALKKRLARKRAFDEDIDRKPHIKRWRRLKGKERKSILKRFINLVDDDPIEDHVMRQIDHLYREYGDRFVHVRPTDLRNLLDESRRLSKHNQLIIGPCRRQGTVSVTCQRLILLLDWFSYIIALLFYHTQDPVVARFKRVLQPETAARTPRNTRQNTPRRKK